MVMSLEQKQEGIARLEALETIVETCYVAMIKGWAALGEILKDKLWKLKGYDKEDDYLKKRWGELSRSQFFHNKRLAYVAANIGAENLPDGTRPSHFSSLKNFEPEMQKAIWEEACRTAPGGQPDARWVEKTAQRMIDQRRAAIKEQHDAEAARIAAAEAEDDEEEEEIDDEDDPKPAPPPAPSPKPPKQQKPPSSPVQAAISHPIIDQDRVNKLERQAQRTVRKLERIALALNCTAQDLLEKYGT